MATVALINPEIHLVPLAEADPSEMESLFDEQCEEWEALLRWDYTGPSRLIREVARRKELSGFAATTGSRVIGFSFYIIEADRCSIGDIFVSKEWRGAGADRQMAAAILQRLDRVPRLRRIESQCVSVGNDASNAYFLEQGFESFDRHYMMLDLAEAEKGGASDGSVRKQGIAPLEVDFRSWREEDFGAAARIIHNSYRGEHDSRINSQYRTEEGCAELLSILTEHVWCGEFLSQVSQVAIARATGKPVGVLIASCIAEGTGHIGQISLLPSWQGAGIGRRMISAALTGFDLLGFDTVSLAVTGSNASAFHLYRS
ncbi:MAG TPA: GNAT family N-acetyltransferase, partial [Blastocatellia bacterium]|nr:GNAT family N-acetyltransferase [Blastocatellia bacterium]